jgi:Undecaprenyl-phosphate glucose phosphotransferase
MSLKNHFFSKPKHEDFYVSETQKSERERIAALPRPEHLEATIQTSLHVGAAPRPRIKMAVVSGFLVAMDAVLIACATFATSALYHLILLSVFPNPIFYTLISITMAVGFVSYGLSQNRYHLERFTHVSSLKADLVSYHVMFAILLSGLLLTKLTKDYSRATFLAQYLLIFPLLLMGRFAQVKLIKAGMASHLIQSRRWLIVGGAEEIQTFSQRAQWDTLSGVAPQSYVLPASFQALKGREYVVILRRAIHEMQTLCRVQAPNDIIVLLSWADETTINHIIRGLSIVPAAVHLAPHQEMTWFQDPVLDRCGQAATVQIARPPLSLRDRVLKRGFDTCAAGLGLIILAIPFMIIAALIRWEGKGPVFFKQRRFGFNQKPFYIAKFRTMNVMEEGESVVQASANDPRITRVGVFLRRTNLDELPQLWNVLRGDMSLVGPRPHALVHDRFYEEQIAQYARRHNVKPGITGWAQVNGCRGETQTTTHMQKRVEHDLFYIDHWTFKFDIKILFLTLFSAKAYRNAR